MSNKLAYYANKVKNSEEKTNEFGVLVDDSIDDAGLKKKNVADEAGIHPTSLSRILKGAGVERDTASGIVRAINKLANREVVDESYALGLLGFRADEEDLELIELQTMYRQRKNLSPARREAFDRMLKMVRREFNQMAEEELAENNNKFTPTSRKIENGNS